MVIGDIYSPDDIAGIVIRELARMMDLTFDQFVEQMKLVNPGQFATGGIVKLKPRDPQPLPEGVVGITAGGRPVYDGDWFDRQMGKGVTVLVSTGDPDFLGDHGDRRFFVQGDTK